ncbi:MAG: class I SAM-dependent methyltransferase [Woeseiaceae bacterium]|nr:class I SAM-dependent methyltransferase [Woeseiaceae bacterium]
MSKNRKIGVDDAYAVETPDDNVRLYADWADTYDSDFVTNNGYVYHLNVADLMIRQRSLLNGAVLDVGCGTGIVGVRLRAAGIRDVDGVDISTQMLARARGKLATDGQSVYRNLIEADLTKPLELPENQYSGIISAGTFTHGHLGPDSLDELWRVGKSGALCVIGINSAHYESMGFRERLLRDVDNNTISNPDLKYVGIYSAQAGNLEHAGDLAAVIVCRIV